MGIKSLAVPDVKLIAPAVMNDERGLFCETYNRRAFAEAIGNADFGQGNHSLSRQAGVIRGLHFQVEPHPQAKLVRVLRGSILDVVLDIRRGSATYGRHVSTVLSAQNRAQLWVSVGFAHGSCTLAPDTEVACKVTDYYAPECDRGVLFDDADLGIEWPIEPTRAALSDRDRRHGRLRDLPEHFTSSGRGSSC